MSFLVVQIISIGGVLAVIALTWAVGWGRAVKIASLEEAVARFSADFPSAEIKGGAVAKNGGSAILDLGKGVGLVTVLGDEFVTRKLRPVDIKAVKRDGGNLMLEMKDSTLAKACLALENVAAEKYETLFSNYLTAP